ncbi:MAG: DNA polymerase III subunit delta' [Candidatus Aminicenantales bacterium]
MGFVDIAGNSRIKKILKLALQRERVPNSILFNGPVGVGKRNMALVLAKALNCGRKKDDACDACASCSAINKQKFPDVLEICPEGDVIKIEQIRFLKQTAYLKPMIGKKRVFIVDEAEKMNEESANSFLKILEEPPLYSHIFLVSSNPLLILPTIISRCQTLNFVPVSREEIENILREKGCEEERAKVIALLVRGNLELALSLEWEEVQKRRRKAWDLLMAFLRREESSLFLRKYAFLRRNQVQEDLEQMLELFSSFCRDFVLLKEKSNPCFLLNPDYEKELRESEKYLSYEEALQWLQEIDDALSALDKKANLGLLVSSLYSQIIGLENG